MSDLGDKIRAVALRIRGLHIFVSRELDFLADEADRAIDGDREEDLKTLRRLLWLRHDPEHFHILYGDDGEMQCSACMIDFKRMAPKKIEAQWIRFVSPR